MQVLEGQKSILEHLKWGHWRRVERAKKDGLPVTKVGGRWMARPEALDEWMRGKLR